MIKQISRDELLKLMDSAEQFKLVDVLSKESYEREHIRGSLSVPLDDIEKKAARFFKKDEKIVVYCASFECNASTQAAEKLLSMGYKNVLDYKGGLGDYKETGDKLQGSLHNKTDCVGYGCCGCSVAPKSPF